MTESKGESRPESKGESRPDYDTPCEVCGQTPTVEVFADGKQIDLPNLCGPCFFGTAEALDPENW